MKKIFQSISRKENDLQNANPIQIYEQPLNERVRLFMRLESVFMQAERYESATDEYETQFCLDAIFSLLNLTRRYELRSECLKELERIRGVLTQFKDSEDTNDHAIDDTLSNLAQCVSLLHELDTKRIDRIRNIEFLNIIKQRNIHDTGVYIFEIPELQYWLQQPQDFRQQQIDAWLQHFAAYQQAVVFLLNVIRESAMPSDEIAEAGMFLKTIDTRKGHHQMLRVDVLPGHNVFPRISGGRHRFAIRFLAQDNINERAKQVTDNIYFKLQTCLI